MHKKNPFFLLFLIMFLAICTRFYRINELAVFLADQASDSTAVFNMTRGDWTLLGPITSIGGFYNGPIVYYLMLPFYFLFRGDPLSGTIFQATLSVATIPFLYFLGKKVSNESVGLITSFLFAISPLMIDYSRAAFNSYPGVFFSTVILYLFIRINEKYSFLKTTLLGICIGFIIQMHYFTVVFLLLSLLYPLFFNTRLRTFPYFFFLLFGVCIGLSPFLLFELRNDFLNTSLFVQYMSSPKESHRSFMNILTIWPQVSGNLIVGNHFVLGYIGFLTTLIVTVLIYIKKIIPREKILPFIILFLLVFTVGALYGGKMQTHYVVSFHTSLILLSTIALSHLIRNQRILLLPILSFLLVLNFYSWNLEKKTHPVQDGLAINDFTYAASLITSDAKKTYNVAMHAQGDNRAMPLRYMLKIIDESPMHYDDYAGAQTVYFIVRKNEPVTQLKMWEYTSFGPSVVLNKWDINDTYYLYRLEKKNLFVVLNRL